MFTPHACIYELSIKFINIAIEWLQVVWPKIIPVAMEMAILVYSLNYPNLKDESLGWLIC